MSSRYCARAMPKYRTYVRTTPPRVGRPASLFRQTVEENTTHMDAAVQALLDRGEESGCIEYSEVDEVAQTLDLEDEQVQELYEEIERRGIDLKDNRARG